MTIDFLLVEETPYQKNIRIKTNNYSHLLRVAQQVCANTAPAPGAHTFAVAAKTFRRFK